MTFALVAAGADGSGRVIEGRGPETGTVWLIEDAEVAREVPAGATAVTDGL